MGKKLERLKELEDKIIEGFITDWQEAATDVLDEKELDEYLQLHQEV